MYLHSGFATGNYYRALSSPVQQAYLMGATDGFMLAPVVGGAKAEVDWFERCLAGFQPVQLHAVVNKWLGENPERWNEQMNALFLAALLQTCYRKQ